jgi:hypothetical protein
MPLRSEHSSSHSRGSRICRSNWNHQTVSNFDITKLHNVRFEVFTTVTMKNAVFWDVAAGGYLIKRRCSDSAAVCSHLLTLVPRSLIFLPWKLGDTFLRNVGLHQIYTAPHPRWRHPSKLHKSAENSSVIGTYFNFKETNNTQWEETGYTNNIR